MSDGEGSVARISEAIRVLVLGAEHYRQGLAGQLGIGTSEIIALGYLHFDGPLTPREIADRLHLTSGSVTALIDRLVHAGFVSRQQHPDDRRRQVVRAAPSGQHATQWVYEQLDTVVGEALAGFDELDRVRLAAFLHHLGAVFTQRASA